MGLATGVVLLAAEAVLVAVLMAEETVAVTGTQETVAVISRAPVLARLPKAGLGRRVVNARGGGHALRFEARESTSVFRFVFARCGERFSGVSSTLE